MLAEVVGKKEILLQKKEIGVDVKETKGHCSATECLKGKGHETSLHKWGFDSSFQVLYIKKLVIIFEIDVLKRSFFLKEEAFYTKE
jgi:hypothetical protein